VAGDELSLWDVKTGRQLRRIAVGRYPPAEALSFSADGAAVTLVHARAVRSWNVDSGKELPRPAVTPHDGQGSGGIAFAPAGQRIGVLVCNSPLRIIDLPGGKERDLLLEPEHHSGGGLALTTDGRRGAAAVEPEVVVFDPATGRAVRRLATPFGDAPRILALSDDGKLLAAVGYNPSRRKPGARPLLVLFDLTSGKELRRLPLQEGLEEDEVTPGRLVLSPDGKTLAGLAGPTIHLWDTKSGRKLHAGGNYHRVMAIAFAGDGRSVATGAWGSPVVRVWDARTGRERFRVPGGSFSLSPDGKLLVTTSGPALRLWDTATGKEMAHRDAHTSEKDNQHASLAAFTPDGTRIVSVGGGSIYGTGGTIRVWKTRGLEAARTVGPVGRFLTLSRDGKRALTRNDDWGTKDYDTLFIWDLETGRSTRGTGGLSKVQIVPRDPALLSPDGKMAAIPDYATGLLGLWDVSSGRLLHALRRGGNDSVVLAFTPDGKTLASSHNDEVLLWDTGTRKQCGTLAPGQGSIAALAFSADGRHLATGGCDATTLIWDVAAVLQAKRRD
jgi:WD40 repeat protein